MKTRMYLIYDSESGKPVHLHVEQADLRSKADEVLHVAGLHGDKRLAVLDVSAGGLPGHPVRVEDGELRELDEDAATGMAGAMPGFTEPDAERRYERVDRPRG